MLFQREKKELWRYASKNALAADGPMINQLPQQHRHLHQHHPQQAHNHGQQQQQQQEQLQPQHQPHQQQVSCLNCCNSINNSSSASMRSAMFCSHQLNTPPPPYSFVPCGINCCTVLTAIKQPLPMECGGECSSDSTITKTTNSAKQDLIVNDCDKISGGCNYVNYIDNMYVDECGDNSSNSSSSSSGGGSINSSNNIQKKQRQAKRSTAMINSQKNLSTSPTTTAAATAVTTISTTATTFVSTAANMFRNCCGAAFFMDSTTGGITINNNNNNNNSSSCNYSSKSRYGENVTVSTSDRPVFVTTWSQRQYFNALMKQLKISQITALLKAVKSRVEAPSVDRKNAVNSAHTSHCILIPRIPILNEEAYVIACRLFFWNDLRDASELKRLPCCPNERDPVYVCCNPLHWCRILETEIAPPPYQRLKMERLKTKDRMSEEMYDDDCSLNGGNTTATTVTASIDGGEGESRGMSSSNISSSSDSTSRKCLDRQYQQQSGLYVRIPNESLTTDGEDRRMCSSSSSSSLNWCQVAYWELAQRVGERYLAKKSSINIYSENPCIGGEMNEEGMCLKALAEKKSTPSPDDVQYTRQKIGLGVTLSQEADGVWLFNRSTVPIFVYSPTLSESWFRVCRVMPGDCLRAFDSQRAQSLIYPSHFPGAQTGPVDTFSMRISFAKGWGCTYKRQDITRCPCWLEVIFRQR